MYIKTIFLLICFLILNATSAQANYSNPIPKKITIYWDNSMSMKDKNIAKEIEFLDNYFNNISEVEVELISFGNEIGIDQAFHIINSDWLYLKETLLDITYDGLAFFENIIVDNDSELILLFTDGQEVLDKLNIEMKTPTYIINSSNNANHKLLKEQSFKSKGNYINLNEISIKQALSLFHLDETEIKIIDKKKIENDISETKDNLISGIVYNTEGILFGAEITVKDKYIGTTTDKNGKFSIHVKIGDVLEVRYLGMQTKEIFIEELKEYDILLSNKTNNLDEVVVVGSVAAEEKVNTVYGEKSSEKLGYTVTTIEEEEISPVSLTVSDAVRGKMLTTTYGQNDDISQAIFRGVNSILMNQYPLIVIDGFPMQRNSSVAGTKTNKLTNFIDPINIADITVLRGLAATNRYGTEGSNGVILITTKNAVSDEKSKKPYDRALLRDNDYVENLTEVNTSINKKYIDELKEQNGIVDKYNFYLKQRNDYLTDFQYFINVSDYFAQLGYKNLSTKVLSNILENNSDDAAILRFVAFKTEEKKDFNLAVLIYKRIAELKPEEAQSYRDLALIYQETGNYKKALNIYLNIRDNKFTGVNFSGLKKNINNEMKRLILKHKNDLILTGVSSEYSNQMNYDARIVFDWNDRDANFEFQFVNPQKKYFTWSHTKENNASRIYDEKNQGFNSEEFLLINAEKGEWMINIESNIKNGKTPVAVKYTVFKNFGKANETKESKLLLLNNVRGKHTLGRIHI